MYYAKTTKEAKKMDMNDTPQQPQFTVQDKEDNKETRQQSNTKNIYVQDAWKKEQGNMEQEPTQPMVEPRTEPVTPEPVQPTVPEPTYKPAESTIKEESIPEPAQPIYNAPKETLAPIQVGPKPSEFTKQKSHAEIDAELEAILQKQRAGIKVIGCGGGGNNTINRITEVGIEGAQTIAINTDAQDLLYTTADTKILIGKELTGGLGAGSIPKIGEEATWESEHEVKQALSGCDMVFVTCGLGGGTGTGSAPVVAEIAKKQGALTVGIVTMPFTMEGKRRYENALIGLEKLEQNVDTLIVIPNDKLLELAPDLPLHTAFKVADEILTNAVKGIAELVTKAGLVNLDFADIRAVMGNGGVALIGVGESDSDNRAMEAVEKAVNNPLLNVDIAGANGALINVAGGPEMTLEEARKIVETVSERLDPDARVIWGAQVSEDLKNIIRTMLIVTGVKSSQIFGKTHRTAERGRNEIENELGIEFVH